MSDQSRRSLPPGLPAERLAYEHTMRVIDRQVVVLSELRTRASIVLTGTGIIASLLGKAVIDDAGSSFKKVIVGMGGIALMFGLLCCIGVLLAVHDTGIVDPARMEKRTLGAKLLSLVRRETVEALETKPGEVPGRPEQDTKAAKEAKKAGEEPKEKADTLREWQVTLKQDFVESFFRTATSEADARRKIVLAMKKARRVNYCTIDFRSDLLVAAAVFLVFALALWALALLV